MIYIKEVRFLLMEGKLQKKELAKVLGLSKSTIRYYEQIGLITPDIKENKYREYGMEDVKYLTQIQFLRSLNIVNCYSSVTGASNNSILGTVYQG